MTGGIVSVASARIPAPALGKPHILLSPKASDPFSFLQSEEPKPAPHNPGASPQEGWPPYLLRQLLESTHPAGLDADYVRSKHQTNT